MKFYPNYYGITLNLKSNTIYQYSLSLSDKIPDDATEHYHKAIYSVKDKLKSHLEVLMFKGKMLWGYKNLKSPLTLHCKYSINKKVYEE